MEKIYCGLFEDIIPASANSDGVKCKKIIKISGYLGGDYQKLGPPEYEVLKPSTHSLQMACKYKQWPNEHDNTIINVKIVSLLNFQHMVL